MSDFAVSLLGIGIPPCSGELSPLSYGAVLLERRCVALGVSRVTCAITRLDSKVVCSFDEKIAQQCFFVMK